MAIRTGYNGQVSTGLIFSIDTADFFNSYKGEPTLNRIPSPEINSYPTAGNGWGTYNTNRYYPFFSIGSVSSVSNNIVTTAGSHTMRSFDVLRPETNGGGVSTGTNYLIKKISDTQFSLHAYNGSQDGSQGYINPATGGYKVHDSFWLDQRVSINASGFPTSWVGEAHLPNSGLVKEFISGGFDLYPSQKTDCIRQHVHRPDSVSDHMAYGPDANFTPNTQVTASFWSRSVTPSAVGQTINFYHYTYGQTGPTAYSMGATLGPVGVWKRHSYQFTSPNSYAISYWFNPGGPYTYDIANIQIEQNSKATPFVAGTRSATQSLLPAVSSETLDVSNVSFDSTGALIFDGTNDYIPLSTNLQSGFTQATYEFICKPSSLPSGTYYQLYIQEASTWIALYNYGGQTFFGIDLNNGSGWFDSNGGYNTGARTVSTLTANQYYHIVYSWNGSTVKVYLNGKLEASVSTGSVNSLAAGSTHRGIGSRYSGSAANWAGSIDVVKFYNRALSPTEVYRNFDAYNKRFGILNTVYHYTEGGKADKYVSNWNNSSTTYMGFFGGLSDITAHGWASGPSDYILTLGSLPTHKKVRYKVYWHLVDSLDNETNRLSIGDASTQTQVLQFTKQYNLEPAVSSASTALTYTWSGTRKYDTRPWGGGAYNGDGYLMIDSGLIDHTASTFVAKHTLGADQPQSDESEYLSHVEVILYN